MHPASLAKINAVFEMFHQVLIFCALVRLFQIIGTFCTKVPMFIFLLRGCQEKYAAINFSQETYQK